MTKDKSTEYFAVVDVETNWYNQVMSVGVVIGDAVGFNVADSGYYVVHPECDEGGMYSYALRDVDGGTVTDCSRGEAIESIVRLLDRYGVNDIFAYNAPFDCKCLPELIGYVWRDILPVAANRNFNSMLPDECEYFATGLLKRGRGVQNVMRLIYRADYVEKHNGLTDAADELHLMRLIGQPLSVYGEYRPKQAQTYESTARKTPTKRREGSLLNNYRYVIDELCGGSVRLLDFSRENKIGTFSDCFYLQCSRCGYRWAQDAEDFFNRPVCPQCGKGVKG